MTDWCPATAAEVDAAQVPEASPQCPHCDGRRAYRHGSFPLQDGTRQPRYLCLMCGRTFNPYTGTAVAYLKKRHQWPDLARCVAGRLTVREAAAKLGVRPATAFQWRHRLLGTLAQRPQPPLEGVVASRELLIPYSEKGSWRTNGPGARRKGLPRKPLFRRFIDGKPSWVVLASTGPRAAAVIVGQGVPTGAQLERGLATVLGAGAQLFFTGQGPYVDACRQLQIPCSPGWVRGVGHLEICRPVSRLGVLAYWWLRSFRGVATRYLNHYLAWYLFFHHTAGQSRADCVRQLLAVTGASTLAG